MNTQHRVVADLLALKGNPNYVIVAQGQLISAITARSILYDEATQLRQANQQLAMDVVALINRINVLTTR